MMDTARVIAAAKKAEKAIAKHSDILFANLADDPTDGICDRLRLCTSEFETIDIPDVSGLRRYIYVAQAKEKMAEAARRFEKISAEVSVSLSELYKLQAFLDTIDCATDKECERLRECEEQLRAAASDYHDTSLIGSELHDIELSRIVAAKNLAMTKRWHDRTRRLISGIISVETHMMPLWEPQFTAARDSLQSADIKRFLDTKNFFAEKLKELLKK